MKKKPNARTSCIKIAQLLEPTMRGQRVDSLAVLLPASTLRQVYELAKKGALANG